MLSNGVGVVRAGLEVGNHLQNDVLPKVYDSLINGYNTVVNPIALSKKTLETVTGKSFKEGAGGR